MIRGTLRRLYALGQGRMLPGRERLRHVLKLAGDPHLAVPSVLVGGTNGKGRVVAGLSAVLSANHRTGAFIKPHLKSIRERWRINDVDVEEGMLAGAIEQALGLIEHSGEEISFFEANVLIGALLFRDAGCEIAVWEVGLGGKEDACNLVDPLLSIMTNVGYDHMQILGDTLSEIATDKAHIARDGRTLLLGPPRPGWEAAYGEYAGVVADIAENLGAKLRPIDAPAEQAWAEFMAGGARGMPPDSRRISAAAVEELARQGFKADLSRLDFARYPARMDYRTLRDRHVLLDASHNADSLRWLGYVLRYSRYPQQLPFIFGCQATRDPREMLLELQNVIDVLVPIEIPVLRPCPAHVIAAAALSLGFEVSFPPNMPGTSPPREHAIGHVTELDPPDNSTGWIECVEHGLSFSSAESPTVICGSIYYLGEILRVFD